MFSPVRGLKVHLYNNNFFCAKISFRLYGSFLVRALALKRRMFIFKIKGGFSVLFSIHKLLQASPLSSYVPSDGVG